MENLGPSLVLHERHCARIDKDALRTNRLVKGLIGILIVANIGLAAWAYYTLKLRPQQQAQALAIVEQTRPADPAAEPQVPEPQILTVTNQITWDQLESEDYRTYITRLRTINCPEQTIRDIIIADLDKL